MTEETKAILEAMKVELNNISANISNDIEHASTRQQSTRLTQHYFALQEQIHMIESVLE